MTTNRKRLLIDRRVQGALAFRVVLYWLLYSSASFVMLCGFPIAVSLVVVGNTPSTWEIVAETIDRFWPAFASSSLLIPFAVRETLSLSNRFAGPMYRLRQALTDLANGQCHAPIAFRDGDYWQEVAEQFNRVLAMVEQRQVRPGHVPADPTRTALINQIRQAMEGDPANSSATLPDVSTQTQETLARG